MIEALLAVWVLSWRYQKKKHLELYNLKKQELIFNKKATLRKKN